MATAGEIIESALKRILVQGSGLALEADEYADGIEALNNMMAAYEVADIRLGYTEVNNVGDEVTVPPGARMGIIANLGILMAPDFGGTVSPSLASQAESGLQTMRLLGMPKIKAGMPSGLPIGSGNDDRYSSAFYSRSSSALLSLAGNTRSTSFATTDTPVRVGGFWTAESVNDLRADIGGRVTNTSAGDMSLTVKITLSATGNSTYTFRVMKNGISQTSVTQALTSTPSTVTITAGVTLSPGDYVELWAEDDLATAALVVASATFEVV